ncbi:MAG: DUF2892 domain-containing protein [Kouleothrix sp.]|nr:DUF2892 domain-containing protein [Kouleothrix sp.]
MRNTSTLDRIIRLLIGLALFQLAFFWLAGGWQLAGLIAGGIALATAALGVCPLYRLVRVRTDRADARPIGRLGALVSALLVVALLVAGSYASDFFTRKRFVEDFNVMNTPYKQALFYTGQNDRTQAVAHYDQLVAAYADFQAKYTSYHPTQSKAMRSSMATWPMSRRQSPARVRISTPATWRWRTSSSRRCGRRFRSSSSATASRCSRSAWSTFTTRWS